MAVKWKCARCGRLFGHDSKTGENRKRARVYSSDRGEEWICKDYVGCVLAESVGGKGNERKR